MGRVSAIAHKCGCGSVWCRRCFLKKQAIYHFAELAAFDWQRTRQIVLTIDPSRFENGREAWEYINTHKLIAGLMRNFQRAYGIKISKWKWFLEWHRNGFPHWHLFIEVENKGKAGMIGGDRIRHYWKLGGVREEYVRNLGHWKKLTGDFKKNGYFCQKKKNHQIKLPEWALNEAKLKIRRSGSNVKARQAKSEFIRAMNYFQKRGDETEIVDIKTGEVIKERKHKRGRKERSYKAMFKECGQTTRIKLITDKTTMIFKTNIPYKEIRKKIQGEYKKAVGYTFNVSEKLFNYLFDRVLSVEYYSAVHDMDFLFKRIKAWHDIRAERGYFEYSEVYG